MTSKELRRLQKTELMELLVDQMKQNEWLQKKLEGQESELKRLESRLNEVRRRQAERAAGAERADRGQQTEQSVSYAELFAFCALIVGVITLTVLLQRGPQK